VTVRLAAVCAIYGGYDLIPPVPEGVDDAVLVTDVPVHSGWRNIVEPSNAHPRLAAKHPKARPDLYTDCEASLWMDGSAHVLDGRFVELVRHRLEEHELVLWDHPEDRDCFLQEAQVCHALQKWPDLPLLAQAEHYLDSGMPEHFGLWAAGCIARRHTSDMQRLGDDWVSEIERWTSRDQISLPYLLWREGIEPGTFGIDQFDNDMVAWLPPAAEIRKFRIAVPRLEHRVDALETERSALLAALASEKEQHRRLRERRSVRTALALANGLGRALRRFRRRGSASTSEATEG
jgi:hypothetical protein